MSSKQQTGDHEQQNPAPAEKLSSSTPSRMQTVMLWTVRLCSVAYMILAFYLCQSRLQTAEECSMTYSQRGFLPLHSNGRYNLYKFFDHRDPRPHEACLPNATAVLYVPGHGGSYQQSRSLGAHGTQMTEARDTAAVLHHRRHMLYSGTWNGKAESLQDFVYEVYALDFQEEWSGLLGGYISRQSRFVRDSLLYLRDTCELDRIVVVAHSIGAYSTRLALVDYPELQAMVTNMVTLGSPLARPILAWDPTIHWLHRRLQQPITTFTLSIGGGFRDELIPPMAAMVDGSNSLTVLAAGVMDERSPDHGAIGMDHRAIVWCHNVLSVVRRVIFKLKDDTLNDQAKIDSVRQVLGIDDTYSYQDAVDSSLRRVFVSWRQRFVQSLGASLLTTIPIVRVRELEGLSHDGWTHLHGGGSAIGEPIFFGCPDVRASACTALRRVRC